MAGFSVREKAQACQDMVRTDVTTRRVRDFMVQGAPKFPGTAVQYLLAKVPIVQWLPRYQPAWVLPDFIAGLTIGVMLIPQGLAYAKIATIPIENGLYSSWIPAVIYVLMGTSKDLSIGPTSMLGLLTAQIVAELKSEYSAVDIARAVAFMVGIYSLGLGVLGLGFILDYVSLPVLAGFISATALTIGFGQVGDLVGLSGVPSGTIFNIIGNVLGRLPEWDGPTCGIGIATILILIGLEKMGKKYGSRHFLIRYAGSSRAVIVLALFTLISYLVNRGRATPLWALAKVDADGIAAPKSHDTALLGKAASRAIAPLVACTLEHLSVGKTFGRKNGYTLDQSQELSYLGVTNVVNSFFGAMPVGGAMSRTAINSECGVRSPLNGIVTGAWILLTLFVFSPALWWIPSPTLSAIIIMAVWHLFGPVSLFYHFWRVSLADFVAAMICFWLTIFVTAEMGIEIGAAWAVAWTMLRSAFVRPSVTISGVGGSSTAGSSTRSIAVAPSVESGLPTPVTEAKAGPPGSMMQAPMSLTHLPDNVAVIRFPDSVFYPNAQRSKLSALESVQLVFEKARRHQAVDSRQRSWSVAGYERVRRLRREQNVTPREDTALAVVVWDLAMVSFVDVTGIFALNELKEDIRLHCGAGVRFRLVNLARPVRDRFARADWRLVDAGDGWRGEGVDGVNGVDVADVVYPALAQAVLDREAEDDILSAVATEKMG